MTPLEVLYQLDSSAPSLLLQTLFEKASIGLGVINANFRFVWINPALREIFGVGDRDASDLSLQDVADPESIDRHLMVLTKAFNGQESADADPIPPIVSHGSSRASYYPLMNGRKVFGVLLVVVDHSQYFERISELIEQARLDHEHHLLAEAEKSDLLAKISQFAVIQAAFLRDVLASVTDGRLRLCQTSSELPAKGTPHGVEIELSGHGGLSEFRRSTKSAAIERGFSDERWQDLMTAAGEAGMNAIVHAGGGVAQVFTGNTGVIQAWIRDSGKGIELENLPRATLEKGYTTTGTMGHGMKMMLQTADRVWLLTGTAGTTVVLEQDRIAKDREWI